MKKYSIYLGLLGLIGVGIVYFIYNKPHQNIKKSKPDFKVEAVQLFNEFEINESDANTKYLDKLIEVNGTVRDVSTDKDGNISVILDSDNEMAGVICQLDNMTTHKKTSFDIGEKVIFKGLCTGMLMDVILVRCVEVEDN